MSRSLPPIPNLDYLKRDAKRILRETKDGKKDHLPLLKPLTKFESVSDDELKSVVSLVDVQLALARDYGFAGWAELKRFVESTTPRLGVARTVVNVGNYAEAVKHYVDWLGFNLDWDWREAEGQPTIASLSRDDFIFFLNEYKDAAKGPVSIHVTVRNLPALVDEWNERRPNSVEARMAPPYEFPDVPVVDAWDNEFVFEGQDEAAESKRREEVRPKMREYIQGELNAGNGFPTPEEVRDIVGPPLGTAIEVLNEFDGYREAFEARREEDTSS